MVAASDRRHGRLSAPSQRPDGAPATTGMAALYLRFCQRLPERAATLQAAWAAWLTAPGSNAPADLVRGLHSLAGAAGLHGLDDLTHNARALEQALLTTEATPDAHAAAFAALLADMQAVARASTPN